MPKTKLDDWDVPLVDYYVMEGIDGMMLPTRQADGLAINVINCRDEPDRQVVALMLYSTEQGRGLLMPLSPETVANISAALAMACASPDKGELN